MTQELSSHLKKALKEEYVQNILFSGLWGIAICAAHALSYSNIFVTVTDVPLSDVFNSKISDLQRYIDILFFNGISLFSTNIGFMLLMSYVIAPLIDKCCTRFNDAVIVVVLILYLVCLFFIFDLYAMFASMAIFASFIIFSQVFSLSSSSIFYTQWLLHSVSSSLLYFLCVILLNSHYELVNRDDFVARVCNSLEYILITDVTSQNHLGWLIKEEDDKYIVKKRVDDHRYERMYFSKPSVRYITNLSAYGKLLSPEKQKAFRKCK